MEEILNNLIDKQFSYENKIILIKSWKKVNSIYVIISDKRTYNFYQSEIQKFVNSLELVRVKLKEGVLEARQLQLNNLKMENSEKFEENKISDVKNDNLKEEFDIKEVLIDTVKKVKTDKGYIPQANTICNITTQLINLKKIEFLIESKK
jgi:adenylate kinase